MGSGNSKQTPQPSRIWSSSAPVSFSPVMVDSLEGNAETDSTRSKNFEIKIQARVAEELKRLQSQEQEKQKQALDLLSKADESAKSDSSSKNELSSLSRESVQKEIQTLKSKLEDRKNLLEVGERVEEAKKEVVKCLRDHDRRPLDCYREVESFKEEVRRLEGMWVEKIVG